MYVAPYLPVVPTQILWSWSDKIYVKKKDNSNYDLTQRNTFGKTQPKYDKPPLKRQK